MRSLVTEVTHCLCLLSIFTHTTASSPSTEAVVSRLKYINTKLIFIKMTIFGVGGSIILHFRIHLSHATAKYFVHVWSQLTGWQ